MAVSCTEVELDSSPSIKDVILWLSDCAMVVEMAVDRAVLARASLTVEVTAWPSGCVIVVRTIVGDSVLVTGVRVESLELDVKITPSEDPIVEKFAAGKLLRVVD